MYHTSISTLVRLDNLMMIINQLTACKSHSLIRLTTENDTIFLEVDLPSHAWEPLLDIAYSPSSATAKAVKQIIKSLEQRHSEDDSDLDYIPGSESEDEYEKSISTIVRLDNRRKIMVIL